MKKPLCLITFIFAVNMTSAQWKIVDNTILSYNLRLTANNTNIFVCMQNGGGVYTSSDNGEKWVEVNNGIDERGINSIYVLGDKVFVGSEKGNLFFTSNNGLNWTKLENTTKKGPATSLAINGQNFYVGSGAGEICISNNNGASWRTTGNLFGPSTITCLATKGDTIFAGTDGYGIYLSPDNGISWQSTRKGLTNLYVYSIALNNNSIFAGSYGGGVFKTIDGGANWVSVKNGLPLYKNINSLLFKNNNLFAVCSSSPSDTSISNVCLSTDNGLNWQTVNEGMKSKYIYTITASDKYIFAGTSDGIWRRPLSEIITNVNHKQTPIDFSLSQNFPNPFNPETTISYSIPKSEHVTLKVFDVLGREVATLVDEFKNAGTYSSKLNTQNYKMVSGVYFYRLKSNNYSETKKLILLQ